MPISKEEIDQARADEKLKKAQERMETSIYGKPVTTPPTSPAPQPVKKAKGGTASSRADGCACRGKTRGRMV